MDNLNENLANTQQNQAKKDDAEGDQQEGTDFDGVDDRALHCFLEVGLVPGALKIQVDPRECIFLISVIGQGSKKAFPYEP